MFLGIFREKNINTYNKQCFFQISYVFKLKSSVLVTFLYIIFTGFIKTKKIQKTHFILQYAWRNTGEINVLILYLHIPKKRYS